MILDSQKLEDTVRPTIGLVCGTEELVGACQKAIGPLAVVQSIGVDRLTGAAEDAPSFQILLIPLPVPLAEGVAFFARCRQASPRTPLVLLGKAMDIDFVVEFLKCGADDFVTLPFEPQVLRRKVERSLGKWFGLVLDVPALAPLRMTEWAHHGGNLGHAYRVRIEADRPIGVNLILSATEELSLILLDLSIPISRWPGGMLLGIDRKFSGRLPTTSWSQNDELTLRVNLPDEGPPIDVKASPISSVRSGQGNLVKFNMKYWIPDADERGRLVRYWSAVQRTRLERAALQATDEGRPLGLPAHGINQDSWTPPPSSLSRFSTWSPPAPADMERQARDTSPQIRSSAVHSSQLPPAWSTDDLQEDSAADERVEVETTHEIVGAVETTPIEAVLQELLGTGTAVEPTPEQNADPEAGCEERAEARKTPAAAKKKPAAVPRRSRNGRKRKR
jgi:CheY-like chemotaxis protein